MPHFDENGNGPHASEPMNTETTILLHTQRLHQHLNEVQYHTRQAELHSRKLVELLVKTGRKS